MHDAFKKAIPIAKQNVIEKEKNKVENAADSEHSIPEIYKVSVQPRLSNAYVQNEIEDVLVEYAHALILILVMAGCLFIITKI